MLVDEYQLKLLLDKYIIYKFVEKQCEGVQKMMLQSLETGNPEQMMSFIKLQKKFFEEVLRENNIKLS